MSADGPPRLRAVTGGGGAPATTPGRRVFAVVPCAGSGLRAGTAQPKQYQKIAGLPLVLHTLAALSASQRLNAGLVVVAPGDCFVPFSSQIFTVADCGGATRAHSVLGGIGQLLAGGQADAHDWVLVHDAARCLVTPEQVRALVDACLADGVGGLLALPLPDTLKTESLTHNAGGGAAAGRTLHPRAAATLPREGKWLAQTPQMFRIGVLHAALVKAASKGFAGITDEASAIETQGLRPLLVRGSVMNCKITWPEDFALAEAVLRARLAKSAT